MKPACLDLSTLAHSYPSGVGAETASATLQLSDERDRWEQLALRLAAEAYAAGYADGQFDAKSDEDAEFARRRPMPAQTGPSFAALELRRWGRLGPGARERFGEPRPGDFQGRS